MEVDNLEADITRVHEHTDDLKLNMEKLVADRDSYIKAADKIINANTEIEGEIDEILQLDETIKHSLEFRDRKLSPVIKHTKQLAMEQMSKSPYSGHPPRSAKVVTADVSKDVTQERIELHADESSRGEPRS